MEDKQFDHNQVPVVEKLKPFREQGVPRFMQQLTEDDLQNLMTYKHVTAPNDPVAEWYVQNIAIPAEPVVYPVSWTPNVITFIGNTPNIILTFYIFATIGLKMTPDEKSDDFIWMVLAPICLHFFSWNDCMDGIRARRQRSGSALGRLVDEALDMIQQAMYMAWTGYIFRFDCLFWEALMVGTNIVFHTMEMKFIMCRKLCFTTGGIGPTEFEMIMCTIFFFSGYNGIDSLQNTIGSTFDFTSKDVALSSYAAVAGIADLQWKFVIGGFFFFLLVLFINDNLGDCMKDNWKTATYNFFPMVVIVAAMYPLSFTPTYESERAMIYFLLNGVISNVTLHLMLTNMCKIPFFQLHYSYIFLLIPMGLYHFEVEVATQLLVTRVCCASSIAMFYVRMTILSRQFMDFTGRQFFIRNDPAYMQLLAEKSK